MFSLVNQWKLTDLTVKNIVSTDDSMKRQISDSISDNLTDSDLESTSLLHIYFLLIRKNILHSQSLNLNQWDFTDDVAENGLYFHFSKYFAENQ